MASEAVKEAKALLNVPEVIVLTTGEKWEMRRLQIREIMMQIEVLSVEMGKAFDRHPDVGRRNWTAVAPALLASLGEPAYNLLAAVTGKPSDAIAQLDVLDFSELCLTFVRLHEKVFDNFQVLSGLLPKKAPSKDSERPSISSSGGGTLTRPSRRSTTTPSLQHPRRAKVDGPETCSTSCGRSTESPKSPSVIINGKPLPQLPGKSEGVPPASGEE